MTSSNTIPPFDLTSSIAFSDDSESIPCIACVRRMRIGGEGRVSADMQVEWILFGGEEGGELGFEWVLGVWEEWLYHWCLGKKWQIPAKQTKNEIFNRSAITFGILIGSP